MRQKIADLREQLGSTLRSQFEKEINRSLHHINEAIAPYTRFVRAERGKLTEAQDSLEQIKTGLDQLKVSIEEL